MLNKILNKGGAGKSLTRAESVDYLNPLVGTHNELIFAYESVIRSLDDRGTADLLEEQQPRIRTDVQKLDEMVLSHGGTPPNGTDLEVEDFDLGEDDADQFEELLRREESYNAAVRSEYEREEPKPHGIRTLATLENVLRNSDARLDLLEELVRTS